MVIIMVSFPLATAVILLAESHKLLHLIRELLSVKDGDRFGLPLMTGGRRL